jgi:two-component system sensor histidine kinase MprB
VTFRRRMVLLTTLAVAFTVVAGSVAVYLIVRGELRAQIDAQLRTFAGDVTFERDKPMPLGEKRTVVVGTTGDRVVATRPDKLPAVRRGQAFGTKLVIPRGPLGGPAGFAQLVNDKGKLALPPDARPPFRLPIDAHVRAVAAGRAPAYFTDATVNGVHARIYVHQAGRGLAVQAVRALDEVDATLRRLAWALLAVSLVGIVVAVGLGLLVTRGAMKPVRRLTAAAEHVAETHDLTARIDARGGDEISRLADTFNTMLAALAQSQAAQRQLVADASHELRTPLTSLRTNIEGLQRTTALPEPDRQRLLHDVVAQLGELGGLVADLVDLAREDATPPVREPVRLDDVVSDAVGRARLHAPRHEFRLDAQPCWVEGDPDRLERAVANLLDNAAKWGPPDQPIDVRVREGVVTVRDHGPGIAAEDLPQVFDRFYRASAARKLPGFGLGLAIVRQVAEEHSGSVRAETLAEGGALLRLTLPSYPIPKRFSKGSQHSLA